MIFCILNATTTMFRGQREYLLYQTAVIHLRFPHILFNFYNGSSYISLSLSCHVCCKKHEQTKFVRFLSPRNKQNSAQGKCAGGVSSDNFDYSTCSTTCKGLYGVSAAGKRC
jgi:hypothetical protein